VSPRQLGKTVMGPPPPPPSNPRAWLLSVASIIIIPSTPLSSTLRLSRPGKRFPPPPILTFISSALALARRRSRALPGLLLLGNGWLLYLFFLFLSQSDADALPCIHLLLKTTHVFQTLLRHVLLSFATSADASGLFLVCRGRRRR